MLEAKWILKVVQTKPGYFVICLPKAIVRAWNLKKGDRLQLLIDKEGIKIMPLVKEDSQNIYQNTEGEAQNGPQAMEET